MFSTSVFRIEHPCLQGIPWSASNLRYSNAMQTPAKYLGGCLAKGYFITETQSTQRNESTSAEPETAQVDHDEEL